MWVRAAVSLLIVILLLTVYFPGLYGPFLFDDFLNIVDNKFLRLDTLNYDAIKIASLSSDAGPLKRPVSMFSFALNYYFFGESVFAFKVVNLVIHCINVVLVFWVLTMLGGRLSFPDEKKVIVVALLLALLWGVHPYNLTSVLYVVQRMASLATLFMLLTVLCYVYIRLFASSRVQLYFAGFFGVTSLLLAVFSKENAVVVVPAIACLEFFLLSRMAQAKRQPLLVKLVYCAFVFGILSGIVYFALAWESLMRSYETKHFSVDERLLTQARVLWMYVRLFFVPDVSQMSLFHDEIAISRSLFTPWSTSIALIAWLAALLVALVYRKRCQWLAVGLGFFLFGHSIEASFFSLELMHEHRNYFPSVGFVIGLIVGFSGLRSSHLQRIVVCLLACVLLLSFITWNRSSIWSNKETLIKAQVQKNGGSPRTLYMAGRWHFLQLSKAGPERPTMGHEHYIAAREYLERAYLAKPYNLTGLVGLYHLQDLVAQPIPMLWSSEFEGRLKSNRFSADEINKFTELLECQYRRICQFEFDELELLIRAAVSNANFPNIRKAVIFNHASSLAASYQKWGMAKFYAIQAVAHRPEQWGYWANAFHYCLITKDPISFDQLMSSIEGKYWGLFEGKQEELNRLKARRGLLNQADVVR